MCAVQGYVRSYCASFKKRFHTLSALVYVDA